jgi:hypothetical protein
VEPALLALAGALDSIGLSRWASATQWVYPAANVLHVLGTVMLVGGIGVLDLRVAGLWRRLPLDALSRALTPIAILGLVVQVASGTILFAADGEALAGSAIFRLKLVLILFALANVALFRCIGSRPAAEGSPTPTPLARASALISLALWVVVATLGRLIAYY